MTIGDKPPSDGFQDKSLTNQPATGKVKSNKKEKSFAFSRFLLAPFKAIPKLATGAVNFFRNMKVKKEKTPEQPQSPKIDVIAQHRFGHVRPPEDKFKSAKPGVAAVPKPFLRAEVKDSLNLDIHEEVKEILNQPNVKLSDIESFMHEKNYDLKGYLQWVKQEHPDTFSQLFNTAYQEHPTQLRLFFTMMSVDEVSAQFSDMSNPNNVQLKIGDKDIFLGKELLAHKSTYFKTLLGSDFKEAGQNTFDVKSHFLESLPEEQREHFSDEMIQDVFSAALVYTALPLTEENVVDYLHLSTFFGLSNAQAQCEDWILQHYDQLDLAEIQDLKESFELSPFFTQTLQKAINDEAVQLIQVNRDKCANNEMTERLAEIAPFVTELDLTGPVKFSDEHMVILSNFPKLETFRMKWSLGALTDDGLAHIGKVHSLKNLDISGADGITDEGLAHLANLQQLEKLNLGQTEVTGAGFANVTLPSLKYLKIHPNDEALAQIARFSTLENLDVFASQITNDGMVHLEKLRSLQRLDLGRPAGVTDEGLQHLSHLDSLRYLSLRDMQQIQGDGFEHLPKSLEELNLLYTGITDEGLHHLHGLTSLKVLDAGHTKIKGEGGLERGGLWRLPPSLQELNLSATEITDKSLSLLQPLPTLRTLVAGETKIKGEGLSDLPPTLEELNLSHTQVTDKSLQRLLSLQSLRELDVSKTQVTKPGLAVLSPLKNLKVDI